jgi:phosphoadenosine phosphosulfate reductase
MSLPARVAEASRLLASIEKNHSPATFACSFGAEDMVVLDLIAREGLGIPVFMLDTGRLPRETLALADRVRKAYGLDIRVVKPWPDSVDAHADQYGHDGLHDGPEARNACCSVRKAEPLRRALAGKKAWITGLRREQAASPAELEPSNYDAAHRLWKFSPLADWSTADVWAYLTAHAVPYNSLHDRGYASIDCEPCTRAPGPAELLRPARLRAIPLKAVA